MEYRYVFRLLIIAALGSVFIGCLRPRSSSVMQQSKVESTPPGGSACFNITSGNETAPDKFPSVVLVKSEGDDGESCTGTFVGSGAVLTAAHCLSPRQMDGGPPEGNLTVIIGGAKGQTIVPTNVFYPKWAGYKNLQISDDIAVIKVPEGSAPAVTPITSNEVSVGDKFTIVGYGLLSNERAPSRAEQNNSLDLYFGTNQVLALGGDFIFSLGESASRGRSQPGTNSTTAPGDSGGPLLINNTLAGTVSWGPPNGLTLEQFQKIADSRPATVSSAATMEQDALALLKQLPGLAAIQQRVKGGERLTVSAHVNLALPAYKNWLKGLADRGVHVQFDAACGSSGNGR